MRRLNPKGKTVRIIVVNFIRQMLILTRFIIFMFNISLQITEASAYLRIFVTEPNL